MEKSIYLEPWLIAHRSKRREAPKKTADDPNLHFKSPEISQAREEEEGVFSLDDDREPADPQACSLLLGKEQSNLDYCW